jgi:hypothetical protein
MQYENGTSDFITTDEGRARHHEYNNTYTYEYDMQDHYDKSMFFFFPQKEEPRKAPGCKKLILIQVQLFRFSQTSC